MSGSSGRGIEFAENFGPPEVHPEEITYHEKVGGGCFGSVFKGECRGKEVAIKKLFRQDLTEKALNDFRKEVEICARLHHPNVLLFMGACTVPGEMAIVMELMPKGNLEKTLHDPRRHLSLYSRLEMAKQTAQGMNWLHLSKPPILHRDLKPSNLLLDKWGNVKVCDFGLSCVKHGEKLKDKDTIPGTPLWMAPEVMMGRPLDEKSDVYAYGIVLWEIATQKVPFPNMSSFPAFKRAICIQNVRPEIPDDILPGLRDLLQATWHKDPAKRPSFSTVIEELKPLLVDAAITDPIGNQMWKDKFLGKDKVLWKYFTRAFYAAINRDPPDEFTEDELQHRCLKAVLAKQDTDKSFRDPPFTVAIEDFGRFLSFFGPIRPEAEASVVDNLVECLSKEWFFGDISKDDAETILKRNTRGFFLIRLSTTVAGSFTISKVSRKEKINHQRIDYNPTEGYTIRIVKGGEAQVVVRDTLPKLIEAVADGLFLKTPCADGPYRYLFEKAQTEDMEGYLLAPSDDDDDDDDE